MNEPIAYEVEFRPLDVVVHWTRPTGPVATIEGIMIIDGAPLDVKFPIPTAVLNEMAARQAPVDALPKWRITIAEMTTAEVVP